MTPTSILLLLLLYTRTYIYERNQRRAMRIGFGGFKKAEASWVLFGLSVEGFDCLLPKNIGFVRIRGWPAHGILMASTEYRVPAKQLAQKLFST